MPYYYSYTEFYVGIGILLFFILFMIGSVLRDQYNERKYYQKYYPPQPKTDKITELRLTGKEITKINKSQLKKLIGKDMYEKHRYSIEAYGNFFVYGSSDKAWLKESANIEDHSVIIAKKLDIKKDKIVNTESRVVILGCEKEKGERQYIIRHIWAIGSVKCKGELIRSVFEQERFKQLLDKYEEKKEILSPYYLNALYGAYTSYLVYIKSKYMLVSTEKRGQHVDESCPEEITVLNTHSADDRECYQVCTVLKI